MLDLRGRSIQYNILQREVDTNRSLYDALLQRYKEIGVAGGIECDARQNGTLRAAYHAGSTAGVEITAEQCIRRGMPVTLLNREQMREMTADLMADIAAKRDGRSARRSS